MRGRMKMAAGALLSLVLVATLQTNARVKNEEKLLLASVAKKINQLESAQTAASASAEKSAGALSDKLVSDVKAAAPSKAALSDAYERLRTAKDTQQIDDAAKSVGVVKPVPVVEGPLVSIIVPTHNRWPSLMKSIQSVQAQSYKNIEMIIIDDKSSDPRYTNDTLIQGLGGIIVNPNGKIPDKVRIPRFLWVRQPKSSREVLGRPAVAVGRNTGVKTSHGDVICTLDDDDAYLPRKIEKQIKRMQGSKSGKELEHHFSATDALMGKGPMDPERIYTRYNFDNMRPILTRIFKAKGINLEQKDSPFPEKITKKLLHTHNYLITSTICFERAVHLATGGFSLSDKHKMHTMEPDDYNMWKMISLQSEKMDGSMLYINEPLVHYDGGHGKIGYPDKYTGK